ncbi:MAG TPA: cytochrome c peroxidase [Burkholderiaceae bacterium]|nr:cytochrome c peroxidase [Burkholderiaceae bacterium]
MKRKFLIIGLSLLSSFLMAAHASEPQKSGDGHPGPTFKLSDWKLSAPPAPEDNKTTAERVALGKTLFFDPRISGNGALSCASCHNPTLGWSDGLPTPVGMNGKVLGRATPTILNTAYNTQFMWDGRKKSLEDQALGPMQASDEMNSDLRAVVERLRKNVGYQKMFEKAYPGQPIDETLIAKAIAAFERSVVAADSPFDRWVAGDKKAMTENQVRGYQLFVDSSKGNCVVCHAPPNFTDNGFHNIGVASSEKMQDVGRYAVRKVALNKGAFKTPSLRDIELTGPYFHDGSAKSLREVIDHYARGGDDKSNLSPNMRPLNLTEQDKEDLVAFMKALTNRPKPFVLPNLPQ